MLVCPKSKWMMLSVTLQSHHLQGYKSEGILNGSRRGPEHVVESLTFNLLLFGHPTFATQRRVVGGVDKLRIRADKNADMVRKILRTTETFEAVCCQILIGEI